LRSKDNFFIAKVNMFLGAISRFALLSFALILRAKGYPLQSGLSLPRGPSFVWQQKKQKCLATKLQS